MKLNVKFFIEQYYRMTIPFNIISMLLIVFKLASWKMIPILIFVSWFVGLIMDKVIKYPHHLTSSQNARNPEITEILKRIKRIEDKI